jgi:hypothetical protein
MSLLDELRTAAANLDPQFQPTQNEIAGVLGALVYYAEHGKDFLQAAEGGAEDVSQLIAPAPDGPGAAEPTPAGPTPEPAPSSAPDSLSDQDIEKQISDLQAVQASRRATAQQTTVTHETDVPPEEAS